MNQGAGLFLQPRDWDFSLLLTTEPEQTRENTHHKNRKEKQTVSSDNRTKHTQKIPKTQYKSCATVAHTAQRKFPSKSVSLRNKFLC